MSTMLTLFNCSGAAIHCEDTTVFLLPPVGDQTGSCSCVAPGGAIVACPSRNATSVSEQTEAIHLNAVGGCRFAMSNTLVASVIVGATSVEQLQEILEAADKGPLSRDLLGAVDDIHQQFPNPNP